MTLPIVQPPLPAPRDGPLDGDWPRFDETLRRLGRPLTRRRLTTLQVNLGKRCNQACLHCHVEAGPKRTEVMAPAVIARLLELLAAPGGRGVGTVDLTGGAPELNPGFRDLVAGARALGKAVIDRCNLTVLLEPGQESTAAFLARHRVHLVASLPCYTEENVRWQRGAGVFEKSLEVLHRLNALGYGRGRGLVLDLVYNPVGPVLPGPQAGLEADYKQRLGEAHGIVFDHLLTLTNMPIRRFRHALERDGRLEAYMLRLAGAFNEATVSEVMCRDLVSVGWDGRLYDCDFNQMLELGVGEGAGDVFSLESLADLDHGAIAIADHCFGCTAGAGSSCGGALD